jgi:hypothetical protein
MLSRLNHENKTVNISQAVFKSKNDITQLLVCSELIEKWLVDIFDHESESQFLLLGVHVGSVDLVVCGKGRVLIFIIDEVHIDQMFSNWIDDFDSIQILVVQRFQRHELVLNIYELLGLERCEIARNKPKEASIDKPRLQV